jgi:DNA repair protein RadD
LGFRCETITSETPKAERDSFIRQFKAGQIRCLASVGVIATGFNAPNVDMIALLRPTQSAGLFLQQCGRGLRKSPGKKDCLILDFSGLTQKHGPIDTITASSASKERDEKSEPLVKECPRCHSLVALACQLCPDCGHQFPIRDDIPRHEAVADASTSILSKGAAQWVDVDAVRYYAHSKQGSPNSLRVEYQCGFTTHKEWVCLQHSGLARSKAEQWWLWTGARPIPSTVEEALRRQMELKRPEQICVRPSGKYFEVAGVRFERVAEAAE